MDPEEVIGKVVMGLLKIPAVSNVEVRKRTSSPMYDIYARFHNNTIEATVGIGREQIEQMYDFNLPGMIIESFKHQYKKYIEAHSERSG